MRILGIETSCDETAAAVLDINKDFSNRLLSNQVASQVDLHRQFGGIVPEVAARSHLEIILPLIDQALTSAQSQWDQIDGIAVSHGPGLLGALLIGVNTAKALSLALQKPLVGVNHVLAHTYAAWIDKPLADQPRFPLLSLTVSGGHTQLALFKNHLDWRLLGQTQDDAAGEAYDKVAKILGLGFPGGPALATAAGKGKGDAFKLPIPKMDNQYDFSFSGLKTAILRYLQAQVGKDYKFPSGEIAPLLNAGQVADVAAVFQAQANSILMAKTALAAGEFQPQSILVAGGVAANLDLRHRLTAEFGEQVIFPPSKLCTDNAAMVAMLGGVKLIKNQLDNPLGLETQPSLSM